MAKNTMNAKEKQRAKQTMHVEPEAEKVVAINSSSNFMVPNSLLLSQTINSREFELKMMENCLLNGSEFTGKLRVFQTISRFMRRRAASHNVKRLPVLFRKRALEQMARDPKANKKTILKSKRRPKRIMAKRLMRPNAKKWLETHIWHAKRMKMVEVYGSIIAECNTLKSHRSIHRASQRGSVMHDLSYHKIIELKGEQQTILDVLDSMADPSMPSSLNKKILSGEREGSAFLHEPFSFPKQSIAPIRYIWRPSSQNIRQVWVWVHPAAYQQLYNAFLNASQNLFIPQEKFTATILPSNLNRFELTGPRSLNSLKKSLDISKRDSSASNQLWKTLTSSDDMPGNIPNRSIIALNVNDPRLRYPISRNTRSEGVALSEKLKEWPHDVTASDLWDNDFRSSIVKHSESSLNQRRSQNLLPGTGLIPSDTDAIIPILLIYRGSYDGVEGWDLILPENWAMPFWFSLIYSGARAAGVRDRARFHHNIGLPYFPHDFPETKSYALYVDSQALVLQAAYDRKPKNKKLNYVKMGVKSPFKPDLEEILGKDGEICILHSRKSCEIVSSLLTLPFPELCKQTLERLTPFINGRKCFERLNFGYEESHGTTIVRLKLTVTNRGVIRNNARIYPYNLARAETEIIGYVTSGAISYSEGKCIAIAFCRLKSLSKSFKMTR